MGYFNVYEALFLEKLIYEIFVIQWKLKKLDFNSYTLYYYVHAIICSILPSFVTGLFIIICGVKVFLTSDLDQPEDGSVYVTSKNYACDVSLTSVKEVRN